MDVSTPTFRILSHAECIALLAAHHVGRIAFGYFGRVDIQPIHYVWDDGFVYGRTRDGSKLRAISAVKQVAFEVDDVAAMYDWRSVVVKGPLELLTIESDGAAEGNSAWSHGVALLRRIVPDAFTALDPTPERTTLFRIRAEQLTGRAASV
ncbi:MAG: pyridoxamine 5'-phosphate oxidase family protein [Gemmatimonadetes bacterium]|nr:pyridoxamine 5'-phosphate oxidase family protein [Gemmatimonadota bacterium]